MPRWLRLAVVIGIGALVLVLLLAFRRAPQDLRTGTVGRPAAAFTLQHLDGSGALAMTPGGGKVYVLNFFASWCIPCKQENPSLVRVYERYRGSDVEFIGILYQDTQDAGLKYVRDNGVVWPTVNDDQGRVAFAYGVFGIPETYFIGPDGIIAGRHIGPIDDTTLINGIECLRSTTVKAEDCLRASTRR